MNIRELLIRVGFDGGNTDRELTNIDRKTDKVKKGFQALNGVLATLFAAGALRSLVNTADAMQNLQSRVGAATGDIAGAGAQLSELTKHANENRMGIEAYADSWAKFETGMLRMGKTSEDTTALVDGLSAAFRVNGTEGNTAAGALFQLTQSISGGTVQMEELNSLMDAQGNLYVTVAEDIGGTTTAFKKMVSQGKVTSKMLAESLIKNTRKYIEQLRTMPKTLGDVWTVVTNDVKNAIRSVNSESGFTAKIAARLLKAWDSLRKGADDFVDSLGGPDGLIQLLKNCGETALWMAGAFAAIRFVSMLATPAGIASAAVLALGAAFVVLKNDFDVWQNGGQSAIDWGHWGDQVMRLADAFGLTSTNVDKTGKALETLKSFSLADWSVKDEIASISRMFNQLANTINDVAMTARAVAQLDYGAATYYADRTMNPDRYYDQNGNKLDPNGRGDKEDYADRYYRDRLNGKPQPVAPQDAPTTRQGWEGDYVPPQTLPGVTNTTTTVNSSPTYNVTVNATTNANPQEIGAEVKRQLRSQPRDRMADDLLKNAGAK